MKSSETSFRMKKQRGKKWFYFGNKYELFEFEDRYEYCGSFHLPYLKNPNREQWIFGKLLEVLSEKELAKLFNLSLHTVKRYKQIIKQLPFTHHPIKDDFYETNISCNKR